MATARCRRALAAILAIALPATGLAAGRDAPPRQSRDDAWWTGPMLANSADTLPTGHILIEPYVYDVITPGADAFGSRAYMLYGLTDDLTIGLIPIVGHSRVGGAPDTRGIGLGDPIVQAQYRLTRFEEGRRRPTLSLLLQESLPAGHYQRLGTHRADGLGSGAFGTTLGLNAQTYLWLRNGRILRLRLNLARSWSGPAAVHGVSVYGTGTGFRGHARPGPSWYLDTSFEYSLTRRWVLALDTFVTHAAATRVDGMAPSPAGTSVAVHRRSAGSDGFGYAPALEYSFNANLGLLLGVRIIAGGHATPRSVTPAIAINYVR